MIFEHMEDGDFERLVKGAVDTIPEEFVEMMENVEIFVQDWPNTHQVESLRRKGHSHGLLLGLYEGVPKTKRGRYGIGATLPDRITIFKIPLLKISRSYDELIENVQETVIHEIGHHFGMSEAEIADAMRARKAN